MKTLFTMGALSFTLAVFCSCGSSNKDNPLPSIEYPKTNSANVLNILALTKDTTLPSNTTYVMNANLPTGTSLKVVFKGTTSGANGYAYSIGLPKGWSIISNVLNMHTIESSSALTEGNFTTENESSTRIEIYENGATSPTRVINITSVLLPFMNIAATGKYGKNILAQPYSSTYTVGDYSFQLSIDDVKEHTVTNEFYYQKDTKITFSDAEGWAINTVVDASNADWRKTTLSLKASKINADLKVNLSGTGATTTQGWIDGKIESKINKKMAW